MKEIYSDSYIHYFLFHNGQVKELKGVKDGKGGCWL